MKIIFLSIRLPLIFLHILAGLIILVFFPKSIINLRPIHHHISQSWMKVLIFLFGLKIISKGSISTKAKAFVSNHISFLDIIVLNSIVPSNFIAKSEIKKWPIIGHLAGKTGTIFINRGDSDDNDNVIKLMKYYLNKDKNIIFFPEGRIGNGVKIKKFHSKLFNSVAHTKSNLQPIFIRYPVDYPSNKSSDDSVCWADKSQTLLKISLRCLSRKNTIVLIYFSEVIDTSMSDAYELAKKSANSVSSSLSQL
jgi:1-acyl-sn-glycerol-3-phosphate acyltransferase|tara:strand:- start:1374 stop:2126 length:753 start_codon:yes stop_codon:yes gene_type:complete